MLLRQSVSCCPDTDTRAPPCSQFPDVPMLLLTVLIQQRMFCLLHVTDPLLQQTPNCKQKQNYIKGVLADPMLLRQT